MVKYEKRRVAYFENAQTRQCKNCKHYWEVDTPYKCSQVKGRIEPTASCILWKSRYQ